MSPVRSREIPARVLSVAADAVSRSRDGDAGVGPQRMLALGPEVVACIESFWLRGESLDAGEVAYRFDIGANLAYALTIAVEDLDAFGDEVETVRIAAWLRDRGSGIGAAVPEVPLSAGLPSSSGPPDILEDDLTWFLSHPERSHRVRGDIHGRYVVRLVPVVGTGPMPAVLPAGAGFAGMEEDEVDSAKAFQEAALAWLCESQPPDVPDEDAAWFATRPARRHRMRPPFDHEVGDRSRAGWIVLVARAQGGRILRLCADEASLPPSDRSDRDLGDIFRALASDLAAFAVLGYDAGFERRGVISDFSRANREKRIRDMRRQARIGVATTERPATEAIVVPPAAPREPRRVAGAVLAKVKVQPVPAPPPIDAHSYPRLIPVGEPGLIQFSRWANHKASREKAALSPSLTSSQALELIDRLVAELGGGPLRVHEVRASCAARSGGDGFTELAALKHHGLLQPGGDGRLRVIRPSAERPADLQDPTPAKPDGFFPIELPRGHRKDTNASSVAPSTLHGGMIHA